MEKLARANLGFVVKIAMQYRGLGLPFEELLSEGNLGLIEAIKRFDVNRGNRFLTYAVWWIRKSILGALSNKRNMIRAPYSSTRKFQRIRDAEDALHRSLGRSPSREEISTHLSVSLSQIDWILRHRTRAVSLNQEVGEQRTKTLEELIEDERATSPEQEYLDRESVKKLAEALSRLPAKQRFILERRFGLDGEPGESLREVAEQLGLSGERVRQIEFVACGRLRKLLTRKPTPRARSESPPLQVRRQSQESAT
jgi:RNA polymerase primary sigma factor